LSGYVPYKDIEIKFTGLRPGEKLYEELLMAEEGLQKTPNDLIMNEDSRRTAMLRPLIMRSIRKFFDDRGLVEVETPVLTPI
ncbi:polysaccharide biosynthesis protein, partial [Erysipelothrix rhusiopathiae]|nr:polysaccharide biosynthesis protein [Erysipelothrix rhusiopathiae]